MKFPEVVLIGFKFRNKQKKSCKKVTRHRVQTLKSAELTKCYCLLTIHIFVAARPIHFVPKNPNKKMLLNYIYERPKHAMPQELKTLRCLTTL